MGIGQASPFLVLSLLLLATIALHRAGGHVLDLRAYHSTDFAAGSKQSEAILSRLRQSRNFTLEAIINFAPGTQKVLVAIKSGKGAIILAGIEIRPLKNQIVVHYHQEGNLKRLISYYSLATNVDHYVTIAFDDDAALVYINCTRIYSLSTGGAVDRKLPADRWVTAGKISVGKGSAFRVAKIANVRLYTDSFPNGIYHNCFKRMSDSEYFRNQENLMNAMKNELEMSMKNVTALERELLASTNEIEQLSNAVKVRTAQLAQWNGCQCLRHCYVGGEQKQNGSSWITDDEICTCLNGIVTCKCQINSCKAGFTLLTVKGRNCPQCFKNCNHAGFEIKFNTSRVLTIGGSKTNCTCTIENVVCTEEVQTKGNHGAICNLCSANASCNGTACNCDNGFQGNGFICTDVNECSDPAIKDSCEVRRRRKCVNTIGSYTCGDCLPGYFALSPTQARCLPSQS